MKLYKRNEFLCELLTIESVAAYITDKNFKQLTSVTISRIELILNKSEYKYSGFLSDIRKLFNYDARQSCLSKNFWLSRGWSDDESVAKVRDMQVANSNKFVSKLRSGECVSNFTKEYFLKIGLSEEEASDKISNIAKLGGESFAKKRKNNPEKYLGCNNTAIEYYLLRGFSEEEAKLKLKERQSTFSLEKCIAKHGEEKGLNIFVQRQLKYVESFRNNNVTSEVENKKKNTRISKGLQIPDILLSDMQIYYKEVYRITRKNASRIKNIHLRGKEYHLDHKYSIYQGFLDCIPPYIIGGEKNLEIISASINCSKNSKCSIDIEDI